MPTIIKTVRVEVELSEARAAMADFFDADALEEFLIANADAAGYTPLDKEVGI